jgi:hypothetical protein
MSQPMEADVPTLRTALCVVAVLGCAPACSNAGSVLGGTSDASAEGASDGSIEAGAGPSLTSLVVSSTEDAGATSPITLTPAFSPTIHDYYVRCIAGTNVLTVSMTASAGATSALLLPDASTASSQQTQTLSVSEGQAIVAVASAGDASTEYWVRCLPYDFPKMRMDLHPAAGQATPGYYLLGNSEPQHARWGYAIILDGNGVPVWFAYGEPHEGVEDVGNVVPGAISFIPSANYPYELHSLSPLATTRASPDGYSADDHELQILPDGHYLILANPLKTGVNLTGMRTPLTDGGTETFGKDSDILDCDVVEFDPKTGEVFWHWVASDHFDPVRDSTVPGNLDYAAPDGKTIVDVFHCNSIDIDPANQNLLVSARDMDSVFYVERPSGKVLWKLGGNPYSNDHAKFIKVSDPFYRQHDARLQPGWAPGCGGGKGQISVFDDHSYEPGVARAVLYDVSVGAGGGSGECASDAAEAKLVWHFDGSQRSEVRGSFRIMADGSYVIGWGHNLVYGLALSDVDVHGHDFFDFYFSDGDVSYRAIKVPLTAFDLGLLRRTAGLPAR